MIIWMFKWFWEACVPNKVIKPAKILLWIIYNLHLFQPYFSMATLHELAQICNKSLQSPAWKRKIHVEVFHWSANNMSPNRSNVIWFSIGYLFNFSTYLTFSNTSPNQYFSNTSSNQYETPHPIKYARKFHRSSRTQPLEAPWSLSPISTCSLKRGSLL